MSAGLVTRQMAGWLDRQIDDRQTDKHKVGKSIEVLDNVFEEVVSTCKLIPKSFALIP